MFPQTIRSSIPTNSHIKLLKEGSKDVKSSVVTSETNTDQEILSYVEELRTIITPDDEFDNIVGHQEILASIELAFLAKYRLNVELGKKSGIKSFLLVGKPGTGKTTIMKNCAAYCSRSLGENISLFIVSTSRLLSKWVGNSQKAVRALYAVAEKYAPSLLLYDEVDSVMSTRHDDQSDHSLQFQSELLVQMDGIESRQGIITCASTNRPYAIDEGFTRRFDRVFHVREPKPEERLLMISQAVLQETGRDIERNSNTKINDDSLIEMTAGFTGGHIFKAVKNSAQATLRHRVNDKILSRKDYKEYRQTIKANKGKDNIDMVMVPMTMNLLLEEGIKKVTPDVNKFEAEKLEDWSKNHSCNYNDDDDMYCPKKSTNGCGFGSLFSCFNTC